MNYDKESWNKIGYGAREVGRIVKEIKRRDKAGTLSFTLDTAKTKERALVKSEEGPGRNYVQISRWEFDNFKNTGVLNPEKGRHRRRSRLNKSNGLTTPPPARTNSKRKSNYIHSDQVSLLIKKRDELLEKAKGLEEAIKILGDL